MIKDNKIFGIGLSRTGSTSLHIAKVLLGFSSVHYPIYAARQWLKGEFTHDYLKGFSAASDIPISIYYDVLDNRYPNSKFILTTRNVDDWADSIEKFYSSVPRPSSKTYLRDLLRVAAYGSMNFERKLYKERFIRHNENVRAYFRDKPNFMELELTDSQKMEKLSKFLDCKSNTHTFDYPEFKTPFIKIFQSVSDSEVDYKRKILINLNNGTPK